ncbi:MAG: class I SAM-dependent methyltransferase [Phycisphaerales bacterium]
MSFTYRSSDDPLLRATPDRLGEVMSFHADQKPREKVLLYAMVFARAPERVLEIGVRWGGGSKIIHAALSDLGRGTLVGLDPEPVLEFDWSILGDRAKLVTGRSPEDLPRASEAAGGLFDFVFVDGDHSFEGVTSDLKAIRSVLAPGAVVLLHDAFHPPVARAIAGSESMGYARCGILADTRNNGVHVESGKVIPYGGVEMLRWVPPQE